MKLRTPLTGGKFTAKCAIEYSGYAKRYRYPFEYIPACNKLAQKANIKMIAVIKMP